ncbi:V-type ATP synthase subunit F [Candidatus Bathyarchaeota archaeon]|nr:V-type ATP synthase subunit F [Candidatus Bathyarchaeota archaeon]
MEGYVIGDKDLVLGFRLVGIKGIAVSDGKESLEVLRRVINEGDAKIIFISEDLSVQIQDELDAIRSRDDGPLIVEILGKTGMKGELPTVQKLIKKILRIRV